jgi:hypothetical protein
MAGRNKKAPKYYADQRGSLMIPRGRMYSIDVVEVKEIFGKVTCLKREDLSRGAPAMQAESAKARSTITITRKGANAE